MRKVVYLNRLRGMDMVLLLTLFSFFTFFFAFCPQRFDSAHRSPKAVFIIRFTAGQAREKQAKHCLLSHFPLIWHYIQVKIGTAGPATGQAIKGEFVFEQGRS